jgi:hypothetical protein
MAVEVVIQQSLEYAHVRGWDLSVRPDWSEIQALSAVDWVRSLAPSALPTF